MRQGRECLCFGLTPALGDSYKSCLVFKAGFPQPPSARMGL